MLLDWVATYESRDDEFSLSAHRRLFENFSGAKIELTSLPEIQRWLETKSEC